MDFEHEKSENEAREVLTRLLGDLSEFTRKGFEIGDFTEMRDVRNGCLPLTFTYVGKNADGKTATVSKEYFLDYTSMLEPGRYPDDEFDKLSDEMHESTTNNPFLSIPEYISLTTYDEENNRLENTYDLSSKSLSQKLIHFDESGNKAIITKYGHGKDIYSILDTAVIDELKKLQLGEIRFDYSIPCN